MTLVADSGSTKTAWCVVGDGPVRRLTTQGVNPFLQSDADIEAVLRAELLPGLSVPAAGVFFYGAGCTAEQSPRVAALLRRLLGAAEVFVGSDMLGAARALCGHGAGVACILGTGANSCLYDGRSIVANVPPLGYVLGDEGSGAYIGKRLAANCLKGIFPPEVCGRFLDEARQMPADILRSVYSAPMPSRYLASLSPFCARHRDIPEIHDLLVDCFSEFFRRNVARYGRADLPVHFAGSVAWFYQAELSEAARAQGFRVGRVLREPLGRLVAFHHPAHADNTPQDESAD